MDCVKELFYLTFLHDSLSCNLCCRNIIFIKMSKTFDSCELNASWFLANKHVLLKQILWPCHLGSGSKQWGGLHPLAPGTNRPRPRGFSESDWLVGWSLGEPGASEDIKSLFWSVTRSQLPQIPVIRGTGNLPLHYSYFFISYIYLFSIINASKDNWLA